jgi:hypothetical protein
MWNPGHLIARGLYRTPNRGNFLPLIEAGHEDLAWTPLLEIYAGKGAILATQLPLVTHLESEPMAAELWRRILSYLKQEVYRSPSATLAVLDGASAPVLRRLQELRADSETVQALDARLPVALVEMNRPDFGRYTEVFRDYVQNGGTLVLHRARPEHAAWLAALTGRRIAVEIQPYRAWVDRQVVMRRDGLAEGLNHVDFHWKPALGGDSMDSQNQVSLAPAEGKEQVEYLVRGEGIVDYLFPGGWTEIPMGRGRVVIDQLKWELPEKEKIDYGSPMRVASMLLSNLGVAQRPPTPKLTLPKGVRHEPVNLAAWVNRGLTDEKAGDGIGWKDWGPGQDLRDFVTGDIVCNGVPFRVAKGDLNAVVLRCSPDYVKSAAEFPERISIPVGRKQVAGLWFLHTGGWTGGLKVYGWREIRYADGSRAKMALNGSNMGDWNYGRDAFPDEEGSATTVAWKGACKMYPVTRVYMTLWINPHPEKEVKEVVLTTEGLPLKECRFLAHLAMTTALLPGAAEAAPARDTGKSLALLGEALALKQAGKAADAVSKLEAAVRADDRNAGAWMELTTLRSATDNREAFMALCRRWIQAIPGNYQAHNQLGLFLEKHDRLQEALAEFKTSLELEGNQPPAIQAIDRIEKRLGQRQ